MFLVISCFDITDLLTLWHNFLQTWKQSILKLFFDTMLIKNYIMQTKIRVK